MSRTRRTDIGRSIDKTEEIQHKLNHLHRKGDYEVKRAERKVEDVRKRGSNRSEDARSRYDSTRRWEGYHNEVASHRVDNKKDKYHYKIEDTEEKLEMRRNHNRQMSQIVKTPYVPRDSRQSPTRKDYSEVTPRSRYSPRRTIRETPVSYSPETSQDSDSSEEPKVERRPESNQSQRTYNSIVPLSRRTQPIMSRSEEIISQYGRNEISKSDAIIQASRILTDTGDSSALDYLMSTGNVQKNRDGSYSITIRPPSTSSLSDSL